ncbi:hypothetical protein AB0H76_29195 [Nocardia sp. NPDC050712]|uniref:hypothetical protein n=1 Tax=Nocardia sp. NPDC050712 TaxID=3155518 RepID=UPI00340137DC
MSPRKSTSEIDRLHEIAGGVKKKADQGTVQAAVAATAAVDRVRTKARDLVDRAEANAPAAKKSRATPALAAAGAAAALLVWLILRRR